MTLQLYLAPNQHFSTQLMRNPRLKRFGQWSSSVWITPVVAGIVLVLKLTGWLQPLGWWAYKLCLGILPLPATLCDETQVLVWKAHSP